jgi:hypothetical protein
VLTGTAAIVRVHAQQTVAEVRGELIPGPPGRVYDTLAMTEDNELTLALKTLTEAHLPACVWVGFNTLVFALISLFQILPPLRRRNRHPA